MRIINANLKTMILNLDPKFAPFQNQEEIKFQSFTFSGGEPHIKISPDFDNTQKVTITHRLNSFNDLGLLCITVDALRRMDVKVIDLFIPYFPAARQDRVMIKGESLSVKVYADIINTLQLNKVFVFDAHSEVTPALVNNCEVIPNHTFIAAVLKEIGENVKLISPDGGALKKIYKVSEFLGGIEVVECSKSRDVKTGRLSGIVAHHIPNYLQKNRLPSWETNIMEDWEAKVDKIIEEIKGSVSTEPDSDNIEPLSMAMDYYKLINSFSKKLGRVMSRYSI